ncbi:ZIP family metal transporter, partial [Tepidanaerobacter acetatoxydans]|uniref:ZIP family metal transporter n=1 Tax=Tepidanaerobacter acetatoxydans TaxID=499229 RepID=UPI001BD2C5B1
EGISVGMPIYFATQSKITALKYTFLSGVAEPIGAILAFLVLRPFINEFLLGAIFAAVAGIMIYISFEELIPTSRQYGYSRLALLSSFAGICIMPLSGAIFI